MQEFEQLVSQCAIGGVRVQRDGKILIVTLDRPDQLNALDAKACFALAAIWDFYVADRSLWVAIVTGEGRAFCSGHDLLDGFEEPMPESGWAGLSQRDDLFKPVIAAVNGLAYGGGWELAMFCDVIVADERARFALPEPKVGFAALGGGAWRLPGMIPRNIAMGMLLTGDAIDARRAYDLGAVNEVVSAGQSLAVAREWADRMLACAPGALRATKQIASQAAASAPDELRKLTHELGRQLYESDDTKEGVAAFAEKRRPRWANA